MPLMTKPTITTDNFDSPAPPQIFIQKWVDYSTKYGIGFILSDQSCGVYFNDDSKIIAEKDSKTFTRIKREKNDQGQKVENQMIYTLDYFPNELENKVDLFKTFSKYLNKNSS